MPKQDQNNYQSEQTHDKNRGQEARDDHGHLLTKDSQGKNKSGAGDTDAQISSSQQLPHDSEGRSMSKQDGQGMSQQYAQPHGKDNKETARDQEGRSLSHPGGQNVPREQARGQDAGETHSEGQRQDAGAKKQQHEGTDARLQQKDAGQNAR